jgi:hypothetical protein
MTDQKFIQQVRMAMQFAALSISNRNPDNARELLHKALDGIDALYPEEDNTYSMIAKGWRP